MRQAETLPKRGEQYSSGQWKWFEGRSSDRNAIREPDEITGLTILLPVALVVCATGWPHHRQVFVFFSRPPATLVPAERALIKHYHLASGANSEQANKQFKHQSSGEGLDPGKHTQQERRIHTRQVARCSREKKTRVSLEGGGSRAAAESIANNLAAPTTSWLTPEVFTTRTVIFQTRKTTKTIACQRDGGLKSRGQLGPHPIEALARWRRAPAARRHLPGKGRAAVPPPPPLIPLRPPQLAAPFDFGGAAPRVCGRPARPLAFSIFAAASISLLASI